MRDAQVAVVGAGPAGLSTAGALKYAGLDAVVFDRDTRIGGSWRRRYNRLHLHTIRRFSGLPYFDIPRRYPKYLSREAYAEYLELYRERLDIDVRHGSEVTAIRKNGAAGGFAVETNNGEWSAQSVVIATGMYAHPVQPPFSGLETYPGHTMHAAAYVSGRAYEGMRVLVVGIGNSGAEIATDLVEQGAHSVSIAVRTMPAIVPRDFLATPVQLFGIALAPLPPRIADRIGAAVARIALGDLTRYGIRKAEWLPFSARRIPVIDVGFVDCVKRGQIAIRPNVAEFHERGVTYSDDTREDVDAVIFATGYRTGLENVLRIPDLLDERGYPKFESGTRTPVPGLYFNGFFESHRGLLFETALASRTLARSLAQDAAARAAGGTCAV